MAYNSHSCKQAIYDMDIGLSFDASSDVHRGAALALAVGGGKVEIESSGILREGLYRAESQRKRAGGDVFPDTTDSSSRQQCRTAFCEIRYMPNLKKTAFFLDSGLSPDVRPKASGKERLALAQGGSGGQGSENREADIYIYFTR